MVNSALPANNNNDEENTMKVKCHNMEKMRSQF